MLTGRLNIKRKKPYDINRLIQLQGIKKMTVV